jgi:hypothetical protein
LDDLECVPSGLFYLGFENPVLNYINYLGWRETPIPQTETFYEARQMIIRSCVNENQIYIICILIKKFKINNVYFRTENSDTIQFKILIFLLNHNESGTW